MGNVLAGQHHGAAGLKSHGLCIRIKFGRRRIEQNHIELAPQFAQQNSERGTRQQLLRIWAGGHRQATTTAHRTPEPAPTALPPARPDRTAERPRRVRDIEDPMLPGRAQVGVYQQGAFAS